MVTVRNMKCGTSDAIIGVVQGRILEYMSSDNMQVPTAQLCAIGYNDNVGEMGGAGFSWSVSEPRIEKSEVLRRTGRRN